MKVIPVFEYPGIFELTKINKQFTLQYIQPKFQIPDKFYGEFPRYIDFYWSAFKRNALNCGLMLTGLAGSGKTDLANALSNKAVDYGMRVVMISNIEYSPDLIKFLDTLDNVILFFDEFGKIFPVYMQSKMLTLLSNTLGRRRIVLITENEKMMISELIRDRPGRLKYAMHFNKLSDATIKEYCYDNNVGDMFIDELLKNTATLTKFTFDHLRAIVTEHLAMPLFTFKELLEVLNLDFMSGEKVLQLVKVTKDGKELDKTMFVISDGSIHLSQIERGQNVFISIRRPAPTRNQEQLVPNINIPHNSIMNKTPLTEVTGNEENLPNSDVISSSDIKTYVTDVIVFSSAHGIEYEFKIILSKK